MTCVKILKNILYINCYETTLEYSFSHKSELRKQAKRIPTLISTRPSYFTRKKNDFRLRQPSAATYVFSKLTPTASSSFCRHAHSIFLHIIFSQNQQQPTALSALSIRSVCLCIEFISINKYEISVLKFTLLLFNVPTVFEIQKAFLHSFMW